MTSVPTLNPHCSTSLQPCGRIHPRMICRGPYPSPPLTRVSVRSPRHPASPVVGCPVDLQPCRAGRKPPVHQLPSSLLDPSVPIPLGLPVRCLSGAALRYRARRWGMRICRGIGQQVGDDVSESSGGHCDAWRRHSTAEAHRCRSGGSGSREGQRTAVRSYGSVGPMSHSGVRARTTLGLSRSSSISPTRYRALATVSRTPWRSPATPRVIRSAAGRRRPGRVPPSTGSGPERFRGCATAQIGGSEKPHPGWAPDHRNRSMQQNEISADPAG